MPASTIAPTVNQLTPIHVFRSKCTRKIGCFSNFNRRGVSGHALHKKQALPDLTNFRSFL